MRGRRPGRLHLPDPDGISDRQRSELRLTPLIDNLPPPWDSDYGEVLRWDLEENPDDGWEG